MTKVTGFLKISQASQTPVEPVIAGCFQALPDTFDTAAYLLPDRSTPGPFGDCILKSKAWFPAQAGCFHLVDQVIVDGYKGFKTVLAFFTVRMCQGRIRIPDEERAVEISLDGMSANLFAPL